jgi:hypothetical protein
MAHFAPTKVRQCIHPRKGIEELTKPILLFAEEEQEA